MVFERHSGRSSTGDTARSAARARPASAPLRIVVTMVVVAASSAPARAPDRELYWRAVLVDASLDGSGRLHIAERQDMVFTGDWNGGERVFRVGLRHRFEFEGLARLDAAGVEHELVRGDLEQVDHYEWKDSRTLRWRSRLPTDPFFDRTPIAYILRYTLSNVLVPQDGAYLLDHDFLAPDRTGVVEKFRLRLTLDPAWRAQEPFAGTYEAERLPPGTGYVVTLPLAYAGPGLPAAVWHGAPRRLRYALAAALVLAVPFMWMGLYRREKSLGRFEALVPAERIDEAWLRQNLFSLLPEVVGAAWDERTGAPEVAAILARLVAEGKIRSEVRTRRSFLKAHNVLHLQLLVDRSRLQGYEKELVDGLFFAGDTTDTDSIREHYKGSGFDPAGKIREPLRRAIAGLGGEGRKAPAPRRVPTLLFAVAGGAACAAALYPDLVMSEFLALGLALGIGGALYILAVLQAREWRDAVVALHRQSLGFLALLLLPVAAVAALAATGAFRLGAWTLASMTLLGLAAVHSVFNHARSRQGADKIRFRKMLAAAREYLRRELTRPQPNLRDEWFPYLMAFGLGTAIDRWFRAYAPAASHSRERDDSLLSTGAGARSPSWSGGGGAFGGAGASASWAAAAGSLAAGVSAPSSGSSGGSSSGGGGMGGW